MRCHCGDAGGDAMCVGGCIRAQHDGRRATRMFACTSPTFIACADMIRAFVSSGRTAALELLAQVRVRTMTMFTLVLVRACVLVP